MLYYIWIDSVLGLIGGKSVARIALSESIIGVRCFGDIANLILGDHGSLGAHRPGG
jgi:hypothetical protein